MSLAPGTRIADRYEVVGPLGKGGMGDVVVARHLFLKQQVALKVIRLDIVPEKVTLDRFEREAHIIAKFRGENVARVLDAGRTTDGMPFIAMELLSGQDLDAALRPAGKLAPLVAVNYVLQVCEGLAEAHAMGIIHRDLKPANLFVTTRIDGTPLIKILDFGISKAAPGVLGDSTGGQVTSTSTTIGSPAFMSPEQLRSSRDVDERTDIWALGVILFRLCSGRLPFEGGTVAEVIVRVMASEPADVRSLSPDVPASLAKLIEACLSKDREQRPPTVAAVAEQLAPMLGQPGSEISQRIARIMAARVGFDATVGAASETRERPSDPEPGKANFGVSAPITSGRARKIMWLAVGACAVAGVAFLISKQAPPNAAQLPAAVGRLLVLGVDGGADAPAVLPTTAPTVTPTTQPAPASAKRARQKRPAERPTPKEDDLYGNRR